MLTSLRLVDTALLEAVSCQVATEIHRASLVPNGFQRYLVYYDLSKANGSH
jgi:hypothetical protein